MKRLLLLIIPLAVLLSLCSNAADSPYDVGNRTQLFISKLLIRDSDRVWFTQHQGRKHPANPLVVADRPWEGWRVSLFGSVLYDEEERLFKMWYGGNCGDGGYFPPDNICTNYATSHDGIHWEKPLIGPRPSLNGEPHNSIEIAGGKGYLTTVMKDTSDPDPSRRYKMLAWTHENRPAKGVGYRTFISPDGLNWEQHGTYFAAGPHGDVGDVVTGFYDQRSSQYVAFVKQHFTPWRGHTRRLFYTTTSKDFTTWTEPVLSWKTDLWDDAGSLARLERVRPVLDRPDDPELMRTEFYGVGAYSAESCTIGFPWVLTVNNNARYGNQEGPQEVQLAVSYDFVNWQRPFRTPVIPYGELSEWDATYHQTASYAIRVGDEIWLYYGGANYTHGTPALYRPDLHPGRGTKYTNSIGLVTWPLDRFVSVDAPAEGGTLMTIPISFSGRRLILNASTNEGGSLAVSLCDAAGQPLSAFRRSDSFSGDALRHEVTFDGESDLSLLAGRAICLQFHLRDAELYSFAFRE